MPDVQNFFHEALAVIIAKLISIYQKKALGELYRALPLSSCAFNVCVSYAHFHFFPIQISTERKCKGALFVLEGYKYLRKGHSVGQTVV